MEMLQLGPAGGTGGKPFNHTIIPEGARVTAVHVYTDWVIDALGLEYVTADGTPGSLPPIGGIGGKHYVFNLRPNETLMGISGRYGWYIDGIRFHTDQRVSELFGGEGGIYDFEFHAPAGYEVSGFFGRADWYIDAIGLFTRPVAVRDELVEGLAIVAEEEAELTAEAVEEALDEVLLEVALEMEVELTASRLAGAEHHAPSLSDLPATGDTAGSSTSDTEADSVDGAALIAEVVEEVDAELKAIEDEAILTSVIESVIEIDETGEIVDETWLSVGESEPVDASVAVRREIVAGQEQLDELEEAVMAEAIVAYGESKPRESVPGEEGAVDITLYTQIVEDESSGLAVATVMAVATDAAGQDATGGEPAEAAVMVTDNVGGDDDLALMEEEAVDGAIMTLMEEAGDLSEDVDVTIFTAIGNDQATGETFAAVVAIASEVKSPPTKKKSARKAAPTKKPKAKKADAKHRLPRPADLQKIEGIGPKIADLLIENGIYDLADLAQAPVDRIRAILAAGGGRFNRADPTTWAEQAKLAASGAWDRLKLLQDQLRAGRKVD